MGRADQIGAQAVADDDDDPLVPSHRDAPPGGGQALDPVEGEVEDIEIAQALRMRRRPILRVERMRQQERHALLGRPAMRAQPVAGEGREIVLGRAGADHGVAVAGHHEVGLAVVGQLVFGGGRLALQHLVDAGQARTARARSAGATPVLA